MFSLTKKYIHPDNQRRFADFKYRGGTDSITYEHVWGPFAEYLLDFFPIWMAPNLITFTSFVLIANSHLIFMFWGSNNDGVPTWKLIFMAVSILIYQTLDNIDGKQARKTKTGSPLGMLFDHGVDSLCSFMIALQVLEIIRIKNFNLIIPALFVFIMLPFFSAVWNQYSSGVFKLGRVNPVDEGIPAVALTALAFAALPISGLQEFHIYAPLNEQILCVLVLVLTVMLAQMNKNVFKNAERAISDVFQTLCLPIMIGLILLGLYLADKQIYFSSNGTQVAYSLLFFWSRNMIQIQLCYITGQKFRFYNRGTNIFVFTLVGYIFYGGYLASLGIKAQLYFWLTTFINIIVFTQFVVSVLKQGSSILDINILTIKQKDT